VNTADHKTYTVVLTEDELSRIVAALWLQEHELLRLAPIADKEGRTLQAEMRRLSAAKARELADRIAEIGFST
jgi:hypothetical protein